MAWHDGKPADNDFLAASVAHIRENFAELAPGRIVDHNLDIPNPPGGHYIRYANGKQKVWVPVSVDTTTATAHQFTAPAAFRANTEKYASHSFVSITSAANRVSAAAVIGVAMTSGTTMTFYVGTDGSGSVQNLPVRVKIEGLW